MVKAETLNVNGRGFCFFPPEDNASLIIGTIQQRSRAVNLLLSQCPGTLCVLYV